VPNGSFEADPAGEGWSLTGDAAITSRSSSNLSALKLPPSSSATSSEICIGLEYPTLRFFARTDTPSDSRLAVHVLFRSPDGTPRQLRIAELSAGATWEPTRIVYILANLLALHPDWDGKVAFRFTATSGTLEIDDIYVDPYER
jgi:hypothetical protein